MKPAQPEDPCALIQVSRDGFIATVVLNRPHKLNALTRPMWQRLGEVFGELSADRELRCIVLRGAGERAFSPGNDISEFAADRSNRRQASEYGGIMHAAASAIQACPHPIVAQIHGVCVGGGLEIACLADLRICGRSSRFGVPIKNLGLVMAYPELAPLVRLIGPDRALEILLEGRIFDADEALEKGLVSRVVADAEVQSEALRTAHRIAEGAPLVARWHKKFVRRLRDHQLAAPLTEAETQEGFDCFDTEDFRIGYTAFLAKQKPQFVGR